MPPLPSQMNGVKAYPKEDEKNEGIGRDMEIEIHEAVKEQRHCPSDTPQTKPYHNGAPPLRPQTDDPEHKPNDSYPQ